jgi:hypothetical protein
MFGLLDTLCRPAYYNTDTNFLHQHCSILLACSRIKSKESRSFPSFILILRNVVLQFLVLLRQFISDILTLRLLSLQLENSSSQLQDLVLDLSALENS